MRQDAQEPPGSKIMENEYQSQDQDEKSSEMGETEKLYYQLRIVEKLTLRKMAERLGKHESHI